MKKMTSKAVTLMATIAIFISANSAFANNNIVNNRQPVVCNLSEKGCLSRNNLLGASRLVSITPKNGCEAEIDMYCENGAADEIRPVISDEGKEIIDKDEINDILAELDFMCNYKKLGNYKEDKFLNPHPKNCLKRSILTFTYD